MDWSRQIQQEEDATSIAQQIEELAETQAKGNMYDLQKYLTRTCVVLSPERKIIKGADATVNLTRDFEDEYNVVTSPLKIGFKDFIVQKPDMAVLTFRTMNYDKSGNVLNNARSVYVWVKNDDTWKVQLAIGNNLPKDYMPF